MDSNAVKAMTASINEYIAEQGIPGIMPTLEQLREAGLDDAANGVQLCGGIKRACKVCKLVMLLPKARKGFLNVKQPTGMMWGQKQKVTQVELTEEMKARVDTLRNTSEYKKRKACHDLGRDLFVQEATEQAASIKATMKSAAPPAPAGEASKPAAAPAPAPAKPVEPVAAVLKYEPLKNPAVLMAGGTDWDFVGKTDKKISNPELFESSNLAAPHIVAGLNSIKVKLIVTHCSAAHSLAITDTGACYGWGRNESGQLALGDKEVRAGPTLLNALEPLTHAAVGKEHSMFVTESGTLYSAGSNEYGAVGPVHSSSRGDTPMLVTGIQGKIINVAAGSDFNLVLTEDGSVFSFGWSEAGCLGHNEDGQFNQSASSVKMTFTAEKKPKKIAALASSKIVQVSAGIRHCASLAADGTVCTWGCGDYGRLGHNKQEDIWVPTPIPEFQARLVVCGGAWCCAAGWPKRQMGGFHGNSTAAYPAHTAQLYMWGKVPKGSSADSWMYPKPEQELQGWCIQSMACGKFSCLIAADNNVIAFGGNVMHRELGFGVDGPKTACRPKKVDAVSDLAVMQVAAGLGHTLFLVDKDDKTQAVFDKLETWTAVEADPSAKRKASPSDKKAKKAKK